MSIPDRAGSCIGLLRRPLHPSNIKAKMITNLVQEPETASKFDACIIVKPTPSLLLPAEPVSKTYAQVSDSNGARRGGGFTLWRIFTHTALGTSVIRLGLLGEICSA
jgi:hypothetical protein